MEDIRRLVDLAEKKTKKNKKLKKGKVLFELFELEHKELADRLRNTQYDPSKNDARIVKFLGEVKKQLYSPHSSTG